MQRRSQLRRRREAVRTPTLRFARIVATARRPGAMFDGGTIVRVFAPRRRRGYRPQVIGRMVSDAVDHVRELGDRARLVVMPAGIGCIDDLHVRGDWWHDGGRIAARHAIGAWVETFRTTLAPNHPPIVLGLDGRVHFSEWGACPGAVQVAISIERRELVGMTFKTKPRDGYERSVIEIAWDDLKNRPADHALHVHQPSVEIAKQPILMLLCHDCINWSPRSEAATGDGSWAATIRRQYADLLRREDAPRTAVNLIHRLPRRRDSVMTTSPCFQSAHAQLRRRHRIQVIAVAGMNSGCSVRAFRTLHEKLACDYRSVDVLMRAPSENGPHDGTQ